MNELYWLPGGNENLKAEQGYTYEGEMSYTKRVSNLNFELSLAAYSRTIADWILWVPGANGNPTPINIQSVWSRGTETTWKTEYKSKNINYGLVFMTSYVLSTVQSSEQQNDNTLGKQLIYTPRYLFNTRLFFAYKNISGHVFHNYTGYRFMNSDNSSWLNPYHLLSLKLNYSIPFNALMLNLFGRCNNILNANYTVISQRAMPLRNYEIGITLQFKTKQK